MARKARLGKLTLSWHERNQQWRKSIGYKPDKAGKRRVPAEFYFGRDEAAAFLAAQAKLEEWRALVAEWGEQRDAAAMLFPEMDLSEPFWLKPPEEVLAKEEATLQKVRAANPLNVSLEQALKQFTAAMRGRLSMMGAKGMKQSTLNTLLISLDQALAAIDPDSEALVLPPTALIHEIGYSEIAAVVNHLYQKGGVAERTALNYARAFQSFLEWMDNQPALRFHRPKGMDALFKLGKPAPDPKVPTLEEVRAIYPACRTDDERLYVLLGINCGMYEVDIANLTPLGLQTFKEERFIVWRRAKTSHQNTFSVYHWLFPETAALIDSQRAPENKFGRLFLNKDGRPISESMEGYRTKSISELFPGIVKRAALEGAGISFKSLRKFGAHELRAQVTHDKDDLARKYLGQAVPGALRNYVRDDFADVTAELKKFRERLVESKVLPAYKNASAPDVQSPQR